ncbi:MAG: hypothetical protein V3W14_00205 [Candidatus Neomarinimicrobiota bacterium]
MVTITSLWLAVLLSAIIVWVASFIIWTVLPHHKNDYRGLPDEDAALAALRGQDLAPGQYDFPHLASRSDMKNPEVVEKFTQGPAGFLTVVPRGVPSMGKPMVLSLVYFILVSICVAYLAGRILPAGTEYLTVFRVTGTTAWLAYGAAVVSDAIWFGRPWPSVIKTLADALIYGMLTAGVFGWLWPA